jgi:hypothetical protein
VNVSLVRLIAHGGNGRMVLDHSFGGGQITTKLKFRMVFAFGVIDRFLNGASPNDMNLTRIYGSACVLSC